MFNFFAHNNTTPVLQPECRYKVDNYCADVPIMILMVPLSLVGTLFLLFKLAQLCGRQMPAEENRQPLMFTFMP